MLCFIPGFHVWSWSATVSNPYILYFPGVRGLPKLVLLVSGNRKATSDRFGIIYGFIPKLAYEFVFRCLVVL